MITFQEFSQLIKTYKLEKSKFIGLYSMYIKHCLKLKIDMKNMFNLEQFLLNDKYRQIQKKICTCNKLNFNNKIYLIRENFTKEEILNLTKNENSLPKVRKFLQKIMNVVNIIDKDYPENIILKKQIFKILNEIENFIYPKIIPHIIEYIQCNLSTVSTFKEYIYIKIIHALIKNDIINFENFKNEAVFILIKLYFRNFDFSDFIIQVFKDFYEKYFIGNNNILRFFDNLLKNNCNFYIDYNIFLFLYTFKIENQITKKLLYENLSNLNNLNTKENEIRNKMLKKLQKKNII